MNKQTSRYLSNHDSYTLGGDISYEVSGTGKGK